MEEEKEEKVDLVLKTTICNERRKENFNSMDSKGV